MPSSEKAIDAEPEAAIAIGTGTGMSERVVLGALGSLVVLVGWAAFHSAAGPPAGGHFSLWFGAGISVPYVSALILAGAVGALLMRYGIDGLPREPRTDPDKGGDGGDGGDGARQRRRRPRLLDPPLSVLAFGVIIAAGLAYQFAGDAPRIRAMLTVVGLGGVLAILLAPIRVVACIVRRSASDPHVGPARAAVFVAGISIIAAVMIALNEHAKTSGDSARWASVAVLFVFSVLVTRYVRHAPRLVSPNFMDTCIDAEFGKDDRR